VDRLHLEKSKLGKASLVQLVTGTKRRIHDMVRSCSISLNGVNTSTDLLRTKYQYSIEKPQKSTQRLEKEIISDNKPLRGGNLLLPHLNVQVQDDSK
jgi:hypothetical protein